MSRISITRALTAAQATVAAVASVASYWAVRRVQRQTLAMESARLLAEQHQVTAEHIIRRAAEGEPLLAEADERVVGDSLVGSRLWHEPDGTVTGSLAIGDEQITGMTPEQMREAMCQLAEMADAAGEGWCER